MQVVTISLIFPKSTLTSSSHPLNNIPYVPGAIFEALEISLYRPQAELTDEEAKCQTWSDLSKAHVS